MSQHSGSIEGRLDLLEGHLEKQRFIQELIRRIDELKAKFEGLLHTNAAKVFH